MGLSKEQAKENLSKLIAKFESELNLGKIWDYNEEATKTAFIQPLLKDVLGWNVNDRDEVSPEEKVSRNRVDYGLKIDDKIKIFVEAKPPKADLEKHIEQAVKYGYNRKTVPFVLLTDFEGLKLFDVTVKPDFRNLRKGLKIDLKWKQYLDNFDDIWLLSKESTQNGEIDKLIKVKPKDRVPVDKAILEDLKEWQEKLAKDIYKNNPGLFKSEDHEKDAHYLREITQRFLDRIIFMRFCEDRKFIHRPYLKSIFEERSDAIGTATMTLLRDEFMHYNIIFDSDLFRPQEWEDGLLIDFKIINEIIMQTYNPYQFDVIPLEVLGNIYEQYLGYTIRLTDHQVKYELKPDVRKAGGVYYTPEYIVDYIVKNTVGKLLEELPPSPSSFRAKRGISSKIKKLRILDPACGSGSFLIRAYEEMLNWYKNQKKAKTTKGSHSDAERSKGEESQQLFDHEPQEHILSIEEKAQILREHIFGVDIDEQAVEVTKLSLMLKMLEGEFGIIPGRNILPMLDKNIKCGNSLISGDTFDLMKYFGKDYYKLKPFNWKDEFRQIIVDEGGFDVVIGNPPWGAEINKYIRNYLVKKHTEVADYESSQYFLVITIFLLKSYGISGMIIPNTFALNVFAKKCREKVISNASILEILDLSEVDVFAEAKVRSIIITFTKRQVNICRISILKGENSKIEILRTISQQRLKQVETWKELLMKETPLSPLINKLLKKNLVLADYCEVRQGYIPYRTTTLTKRLGRVKADDIVSNRLWHSLKKESPQHLKELQGFDVKRYFLNWSNVWVRYGEWVSTYLPLNVFSGPRVLIREINSKYPHVLNATFTDEIYVHNPSVLAVLSKRKGLSIKCVLGILNSHLMSVVFMYVAPKAKKGLFPKIIITDARRLPFPYLDLTKPTEKKIYADLEALVDLMLDLNKKLHTAKGSEKEQIQRQIEKTDKEIDDIVYKLYGINDEERKIIE